ncbi:hypothetical protein BKA67DRAFT_535752 [Truncatella angustata]|uniref:Uncharacterized protein n=1 Tax=Truncatella angustata TaxID=152316 RepID=A0A9P8UKX4_9PEZI|nr:uncharacterized protein BKA67DRAFT_535752 [Truncatella angustata]KAH6654430.1 hypothetical protein BKA67DRAFT_535752 [Truncatella angustata]
MLLPLLLLSLPVAILGVETAYATTEIAILTVIETVAVPAPSASAEGPPPAPPSSGTTTEEPPPPPPSPAPTTLSTSFTTRCDNALCSEGSRWCFYWAGVTSWDVSLGPIPGETHTILGPVSNLSLPTT